MFFFAAAVSNCAALICLRNSARFVWKRTAQTIKESSPELVAAWKIVQNMWTHDHAGVYKALKGFDWSEQVQPVATAISSTYPIDSGRMKLNAFSSFLMPVI